MDKHTRIKREQVEPLRADDLDATNTSASGQVLAKAPDGRFTWINNLLHIFTSYVEKLNITDADITIINDSEANGVVKRISWNTIKTILKNYFNGIYTSPNSLKTLYQDSLIESNTSSRNYVNKVTLSIIPMPGEYILEWNFQISNSCLISNAQYKVYSSTGAIYSEAVINCNLPRSNQGWNEITGFIKLILTTTPLTFYLDYCRPGSGQVYIKNAKLLLRRIVI